MADHDSTNQHHDASDRALDQAATAEQKARAEREAKGPRHDPEKIRQHDDTGRDRLFEGREQHDEAEKNSEKERLARDAQRHHHPVDDDVADSGSGPGAKRKS